MYSLTQICLHLRRLALTNLLALGLSSVAYAQHNPIDAHNEKVARCKAQCEQEYQDTLNLCNQLLKLGALGPTGSVDMDECEQDAAEVRTLCKRKCNPFVIWNPADNRPRERTTDPYENWEIHDHK